MRGFTIRLETSGFGDDPQQYAEFVRNGLRDLTMANLWSYRHDPKLPSVYDAGIVYRREPRGYEQFCDVLTVLRRGWGDCEDLACAVAAWRVVRTGELARPRITWKPLGGGHWLYHIRVNRADGSVEDPSAALGMRDEPGEWVQRDGFWKYELFPGRDGVVPDPLPVVERIA